MPQTFDCIVIGLGGFGSSALFHLAARGAKVLGIEQFTPAHDLGSSHGRTRIIRKAYFEHPDYVPLLHRAYQLWAQLELRTGRRLYRPSGLLLSGEPECEVISGALRAARMHRLSVESLTVEDARERWPAFRFPEGHAVVFEPDAGCLFVEECVRAHLDVAVECGASVQFHNGAARWRQTSHGVTVRTDHGEHHAASLILAAGAWMSTLAPNLLPPLTILRKVQLWQPVGLDFVPLYEQSPAYLFDLHGRNFYGFPCLDGATVKMAEHTSGEQIDEPENVHRGLTSADTEPIQQFIRSCLKGVGEAPREHAVCLYTMSPDGHFVVDKAPGYQGVILAAGFSGHGFKFTSVIGEALADLALAGRTELPIGFLGLKRFIETD